MVDYFNVLQEPRRPWLDPDQLKEKFLTLSAQVHPDRVHQCSPEEKENAHRRYTELNTAYQCLREPKERLRCLIELETGQRPADVQAVPDGLLDWFVRINSSLRDTDALLQEKVTITSPLLKVGLLERSQPLIDQLQSLLQQLEKQQAALLRDLQSLAAQWDTATHDWSRLGEICQRLSYLNRWASQIRERTLQLSL
jgi:DnaJ-domain-containing protein 1